MSPRKTDASPSWRDKLDAASRWFNDEIVGQENFAEQVLPRVIRYEYGLGPRMGGPLGSWILAGPSGVGKTESVYALARYVHKSPARGHVLRVNCGEYQNQHEVAKLIGAPPGYLGHRETQPVLAQVKLNAAMSENANVAFILLDEIEKAHPAFYDVLLGILDGTPLKLGDNSAVNFDRTFIFMSSNLGFAKEVKKADYSFAAAGGGGSTLGSAIRVGNEVTRERTVRGWFRPEFINRLTGIVQYQPLTREHFLTILARVFHETWTFYANRIHPLGCTRFEATTGFLDAIADKYYNEVSGGRHINRIVEGILGSVVMDAVDDPLKKPIKLTAASLPRLEADLVRLNVKEL